MKDILVEYAEWLEKEGYIICEETEKYDEDGEGGGTFFFTPADLVEWFYEDDSYPLPENTDDIDIVVFFTKWLQHTKTLLSEYTDLVDGYEYTVTFRPEEPVLQFYNSEEYKQYKENN